MSSGLYDPGSKIRLSARFEVAGDLTDPTTVTLKVQDPAGAITTYTLSGGTVTKAATGRFYKDLTPTAPGRWYYKWIGTGTVESTTEESFQIRSQVIA